MSTTSLLESLPPPYTVAPRSVLGQLIDVLSLQLEAGAEDVGRLRLTHWIDEAYRLGDVAALAALVGVAPLAWETRDTFRARLIPLVASRLRGSVSRSDIMAFVVDYLQRAEVRLGQPEDGLPAVLVAGLGHRKRVADAFADEPDRPGWRPLAFVENPARERWSAALAERGGRVGHLARWTDRNAGLDPASVRITITGWPGGRTSVPVLVNLTSGEWIGFAGAVPVGAELAITSDNGESGPARASLAGFDVTDRLIGGTGYPPPGELRPPDGPRIPRQRVGHNDWLYASAGLYDVPGADREFFSFAPPTMAEGRFDGVRYDQAIFPVGVAAHVALAWTEREPASFEVRVPRGLTLEPSGRPPLADAVGEALREAVGELRAAGVAAAVVLEPFAEVQRHAASVELPWRRMPDEVGPTGTLTSFEVGGRFGETAFGATRFD